MLPESRQMTDFLDLAWSSSSVLSIFRLWPSSSDFSLMFVGTAWVRDRPKKKRKKTTLEFIFLVGLFFEVEL